MNQRTSTFSVLSPAKINTVLRIGKKRADGYHPVESLMLKLDWGDRLRVAIRPTNEKTRIHLNCFGSVLGKEKIAGENNIAYQAAREFSEHFKKTFDLRIDLEKRIPMQAGLGGGSSNAASVLQVLFHVYRSSFSRREKAWLELHQIAASLGSDLNFFLSKENAAWCTGRGEIIVQKSLPRWPIVLVFPKTKISTAWAYRKLDDFYTYQDPTLFTGYHPEWERKDRIPVLENDFQAVALEEFSELRKLLKDLCLSGAVNGQMTGSGSCFFGIYSSVQSARKAQRALLTKGWNSVACQVSKF